jgi:hypothetical protein
MALCNWAKFRLPPVSVVVTLPAEIDLYSRQQVYDRLCGACVSGAPVVIADFTSTRHCDTESMRRLLAAHEFAAASTAQLRFAIPPGSPVRRVLDSLDPDRRVPVYDSLGEELPGRACQRDAERSRPEWGTGGGEPALFGPKRFS